MQLFYKITLCGYISAYRLKKYDTSQKILESLTIVQSRIILFSIVKKAKTAAEISMQKQIPISTVYKSLTDLEELSLIYVEKIELSNNGKKMKRYKSRISGAKINFGSREPTIHLEPNMLARLQKNKRK